MAGVLWRRRERGHARRKHRVKLPRPAVCGIVWTKTSAHQSGAAAMELTALVQDIHRLNHELERFERKYGIMSDTFYESYNTKKTKG
jgi:hypothetical protein